MSESMSHGVQPSQSSGNLAANAIPVREFEENFVLKHVFEGIDDAAHRYYKQRQTSIQKALYYGKNLPKANQLS